MNVNGYQISPYADLSGANLSGADLHGADLRYANLHSADLRYADLSGANLRDANLRKANLRSANLSGANLRYADLRDANLYGAENIPALALAQTSILPAGDLTGWKKCAGGVIVCLRIPAAAKRSNATGRKCRAEYTEVTEVIGAETEVIGAETAYSLWDARFTYTAGQTVRPAEPFDKDRWRECASGIHFFITREEAEDFPW